MTGITRFFSALCVSCVTLDKSLPLSESRGWERAKLIKQCFFVCFFLIYLLFTFGCVGPLFLCKGFL